jgi:glutathione S-transferase
MIILYQPPTAWGVPNLSPFCFKLEAYLRMAGLPYEAKLGDPRKGPKGKMPYVDIGGQLLGDSQLIIEHLKRTHGDPLDSKLGPTEVAIGHTVRRMLEESTYWNTIIHDRWATEAGWQAYQPAFKPLMPPVIDGLVLKLIRRSVLKAFHAQGMGRHRPEEIHALGKADISAVATLLGDKPFLLGDAPTSFDATVYAFLMSILVFPVESPVQRYTQDQQNLVRYCERFKQRFFADWKPSPAMAQAA